MRLRNLLRSTLLSGLVIPGTLLAGSLSIELQEPKSFTDLESSGFGYDSSYGEFFVRELQSVAKPHLERDLPPGYVLHVRFTDVDMAGEFEEWRTPPADDIRFMRSVYPPRLNFAWKITDGNGEVVRSGNEYLTELAYAETGAIRRVIFHDREFFYEQELFLSWLSRTLRDSDLT